MLNYKKVRGFLMLNYKKVRALAVAVVAVPQSGQTVLYVKKLSPLGWLN